MAFSRNKQSNQQSNRSRGGSEDKNYASFVGLYERNNSKGPIATGFINLDSLRDFIQEHKGEKFKVVLWDNRERKKNEKSPDFSLSIQVDDYEKKAPKGRSSRNDDREPGGDDEAPF